VAARWLKASLSSDETTGANGVTFFLFIWSSERAARRAGDKRYQHCQGISRRDLRSVSLFPRAIAKRLATVSTWAAIADRGHQHVSSFALGAWSRAGLYRAHQDMSLKYRSHRWLCSLWLQMVLLCVAGVSMVEHCGVVLADILRTATAHRYRRTSAPSTQLYLRTETLHKELRAVRVASPGYNRSHVSVKGSLSPWRALQVCVSALLGGLSNTAGALPEMYGVSAAGPCFWATGGSWAISIFTHCLRQIFKPVVFSGLQTPLLALDGEPHPGFWHLALRARWPGL
jgi:hypothetical protein